MLLLDIESTKKNTLAVYTTTDTFTMIDMTLHIQFSHAALNARQSSNSFVLRDLYIFTNHCVTSTFILHRALLQHSTDIQFSFLEEKIVKLLREWLQNHPLT